MKIYYHPVSTTSRMVMMCAGELGIKADWQVVDLMIGEHLQPAYLEKNPNGLVPMLEEGDFRLTESSTILKYLADQAGSPAYPRDVKSRAKVNEMMDWFNSNLYKDIAYGLVYPQVFPHHKRPDDAVQSGTLAWAKDRTRHWLKILDGKLLGPRKTWLCGESTTIADFFGGEIIGLGELVRCDYAPYPNVHRWLGRMKALPSWKKVHEAFDGFRASVKDMPFAAI